MLPSYCVYKHKAYFIQLLFKSFFRDWVIHYDIRYFVRHWKNNFMKSASLPQNKQSS